MDDQAIELLAEGMFALYHGEYAWDHANEYTQAAWKKKAETVIDHLEKNRYLVMHENNLDGG